MVKATYVDKNGVKKGAWTEEEDNKLRAYVLRYGHWNWRLLPKFAGLQRCGKSCRLRWMNYLKPGVKRGNYSQEERDLIAKLHGELGKKWSAIAAKLPGRTDNDIKNYWHGHLKKPEKRTSSSAQQAEIFPEKQWSVVIHNQNLEEAFADSNASSVSPKIHSGEVVNSESSSDTSCGTFVSESSSSVSGNIDWDLDSSSADKKCSEKLPDFSPLSIDSGATDESSIFPDLISGFHESFWTQPFMVDTCSYNHDYSFCVLDEAGLFSPELSYCDENAINMF